MPRKRLISEASREQFPNGYRILQGRQEFVTYPEDSTIRMWYGDTPDAFALHWHTAAEIVMVLEGECIYETSQRSYHVHADEVLIVPPRCPHTLSMGRDSRRCLFLFEADTLEQMRDFAPLFKTHTQPIHLTAEAARRLDMQATLNQIISLYRFREPMWNTMCYSLLMQTFALLGRISIYDADAPEPLETAEKPMVSTEIMDSVLSYINHNYMKDISLEHMAAFTGYSKWYFSRIFKQHTGMAFTQFLTQVRIANVRQALVHERTSVADICARSGFSSATTFHRTFKDITGCTPSEYRAIYGKRRSPLDTPDETP